MAIVDSKGRLFGKVSILDIGAALVVLLVLVGVLLPSLTGAQLSSNVKPVEVDVVIRSVGSKDPKTLLKEGGKTSLIVRNQNLATSISKQSENCPAMWQCLNPMAP